MEDRLHFSDVVKFMKKISIQLSSNYELYDQCKLSFAYDNQRKTISLSVELMFDNIEKIEAIISRTKKGEQYTWFFNGVPVSEDSINYKLVFDKFRLFNKQMFISFSFLHDEPESENWDIKYHSTDNSIQVQNKSSREHLFKITFDPYESLDQDTNGMIQCKTDTHYLKFINYGQLNNILHDRGIVSKRIGGIRRIDHQRHSIRSQLMETDQMWTAIHKLSNILERSSLTPSR